jgi:hypothetical protein
MTNQELFKNTDVGLYRPPSTSLIHIQWEAFEAVGLAVADYEAIEQNLEGLTAYVSDISIDEIL